VSPSRGELKHAVECKGAAHEPREGEEEERVEEDRETDGGEEREEVVYWIERRDGALRWLAVHFNFWFKKNWGFFFVLRGGY
jgi:hypothetical protein